MSPLLLNTLKHNVFVWSLLQSLCLYNQTGLNLLIEGTVELSKNKQVIKIIHTLCFLTGRKQRVSIIQQGRTEVSNTLEVNTGAPQGCVLTPALFTVYTNDCTAGSENCTIIKYADDTVLLGYSN